MKKKLAFILAFVILSVSIFAVPVMANNGYWYQYEGNYYYIENNSIVTGWIWHDGAWYYSSPEYGYRFADGGAEIGGKHYYFNEYGRMLTGWQKLALTNGGTGWFYFDSSGARQEGWVKDGGTWYLLNDYGCMLTGWQKSGSTWYYLKPSGAMVTGWYKIDGYWYYFSGSGAMQTGWLKDGSSWYYLDPEDGYMYYNGGYTIGGNKYLFASSGKMLTGWQKWTTTSGKLEWFYLSSSGAMVTGWFKDGGKWYYLNESMAHDCYLDYNGKRYYFNSSGVCTNP